MDCVGSKPSRTGTAPGGAEPCNGRDGAGSPFVPLHWASDVAFIRLGAIIEASSNSTSPPEAKGGLQSPPFSCIMDAHLNKESQPHL